MKKGKVYVASVSIFKDKKVLMIKENKPSVINLWNFPSGRLDPGETIMEAARREVKEETGLEVRLTGTTGAYHFTSIYRDEVILYHFTAEITGGTLAITEEEIVEGEWAELSQFSAMDDKELREASVLKRIFQNLSAKRVYSIDKLNSNRRKIFVRKA